MKTFTTFIFLLLLAGTQAVLAQNAYKWDRYSLSFEAPFKLDLYDTESEDVFGSDNDNYAVDVSGFSMDYYNQYVKESDMKSSAFSIAKAYGFFNIKDGGALPKLTNGYYVICDSESGIEGARNAVVILVLGLDEKRKHYIEGTIYCYDRNQANGVQIAKTFSFAN